MAAYLTIMVDSQDEKGRGSLGIVAAYIAHFYAFLLAIGIHQLRLYSQIFVILCQIAFTTP